MDSAWLDGYLEAWVLHAKAGSAEGADELATLLDRVTADVRYEDIPTAAVFIGHPGVTRMCQAAHGWAADLEFKVVTGQTDGTMFALETETSGTTPPTETGPGRVFLLRGVSIGRVSPSGLVCEHRDYWDLGSFLAQVSAPG